MSTVIHTFRRFRADHLFHLFVISIPLNQYISTRLLFVLAILSLFYLLAVRRTQLKFILSNAWDCLLYSFVLIAGLSYTPDLQSGLRILETSFPLLALPIAFSRISASGRLDIFACFRSFSIGLFVACLILIGHSGYKLHFGSETFDFTYYSFTDILGFQPTYFSYYLVFGITYNMYVYFYGRETVKPLWHLTSILIFFCCLLLTSSKTTFVTLTLVSAFFLLRFLNEEVTSRKKIATLLGSTMLLSVFFVQLSDLLRVGQGDAWDRGKLWEASVQAIPNWIFGTGTGGEKAALTAYFNSHNMIEYAKEGFNAHNQIIEVLLSNGIFGLLALIVLLTYSLYRATRGGYMLVVISLFPFILYGITEVFLGRYQGIVFFVFLHQIFSYWMTAEERQFLPLTKRGI